MEENKNEEVIQEVTEQQETPTKEEPKVDDTVEKISVKEKTLKKFSNDHDAITKVDLSKPPKTKEDEQPLGTTKPRTFKKRLLKKRLIKKRLLNSLQKKILNNLL